MLKTSPVLASSANASPTSFHLRHAHAHAHAHAQAPSPAGCPTTPRRSSRAASSSSASASSGSAASMRSPAPVPASARPSHRKPIAASPSASGPTASTFASAPASDDGAASNGGALDHHHHQSLASRGDSYDAAPASSMTKSTPSQAPVAPSSPSSAHSRQVAPLSPVKRRGSPGTGVDSQPSTTSGPRPSAPGEAPTSNSAKRARPDQRPPKVLPQRYELCAVEDVVELIAKMLSELIATNDNIPVGNGNLTRFHSRTAPGISVRDYLHRLAKHATLTPPLLLAMVYYIDRLCAMYPDFTINTLTVHRFLITAATVAAKGLSDAFWNNTTYARVGGVRLQELKLLELEFLHWVDWKIVPNPEVLVAYYHGLIGRAPEYTLELDSSSGDGLDDDEDEDEEDHE